MRKRFALKLLIAADLLGCLLLSQLPARAQPFDFAAPADSPLWWPVGSQLSAEQLRTTLTDRAANQARFLTMLEQGALPRTGNLDMALELLILAVDFQKNPELCPVFIAFISLSGRVDVESDKSLTQAMVGYGLSTEQAAAVLATARKIEQRSADWHRRIAADAEFVAVLRSLGAGLEEGSEARRELASARRNQDVEYFAQRTKLSRERLHELLKADQARPLEKIFVEEILRLREHLGEDGWACFRRYLEKELVRGGTLLDFES